MYAIKSLMGEGVNEIHLSYMGISDSFPGSMWCRIKIAGGKEISSRVKNKKNRAGQALRDAANARGKAQNPLGDYLRRKKAKTGSEQANVATAGKIAVMCYKLVTAKVEFDPSILNVNTSDYLQNKLRYLEKSVEKTKLLLSENQRVASSVI